MKLFTQRKPRSLKGHTAFVSVGIGPLGCSNADDCDWQSWDNLIVPCDETKYRVMFNEGDAVAASNKENMIPWTPKTGTTAVDSKGNTVVIDLTKMRKSPVFNNDMENWVAQTKMIPVPSKFFCTDWSLVPWDDRGINHWGLYDYLINGPSSGEERVKLMWSKILTAPFLPKEVQQSWSIHGVVRDSAIAIDNIRQDLLTSLTTVSGREALAKKMGIPLDTLKKDYPVTLDWVYANLKSIGESFFTEVWKSYGKAITDSVKEFGLSLASEIGIDVVSESSQLMKGFGASIPFIGTMVTMTLDMVTKMKKDADNAQKQYCIDLMKKMTNAMQEGTNSNLPANWHLEEGGYNTIVAEKGQCIDIDGDYRATVAEAADWCSQALIGWNRWFVTAPERYKPSILAWWKIVTMMAIDKTVTQTLQTMCRGLLLQLDGGPPPSDEQVMVIGVPIAISYNFDPVEFCTALWNKSAGFIEAMAYPGKVYINSDAANFYPHKHDVPYYRLKHAIQCEKTVPAWGGAERTIYTGKQQMLVWCTLTGGFFANMAVLAKDAFELAEEWKANGGKKVVPPSMPELSTVDVLLSSRDSSTFEERSLLSSSTAIGLGLFGSAALITLGLAPLFTVPTLLGALFLASRGKTVSTTTQSKPPLPMTITTSKIERRLGV